MLPDSTIPTLPRSRVTTTSNLNSGPSILHLMSSPKEGADPPPSDTPLRRVGVGLLTLASRTLEVATTTLSMMRYPLWMSGLLVISVLIVCSAANTAIDMLRGTAENLCVLPVFSHLAHCTPNLPLLHSKALADFPSLTKIQIQALDELAGQSGVGSTLALNLKRAEVSVKDLVVAVRASNMTEKYMLANILTGFVVDARAASRSLQEVSAKINALLDSITVFNAYAYRAIEHARTTSSSRELAVTVSRSYMSSLGAFSTQINHIVADAAKASETLDRLEERLADIHGLCINETFIAAVAHDKLLWDVRAFFDGTYQEKRRDLKYRAAVLEDVDYYRNLAASYTSVTMQALMTIDTDLSELQDRFSGPTHGSYDIPLEVQLGSIERTLVRLKDEMQQAKITTGDGSSGLPRVASALRL